MKRFWTNFARWSIYFVVASFFGHWLEIAVQVLIDLVTGAGVHTGIMSQPLEPYPVYGLAVFAMVALSELFGKSSAKTSVKKTGRSKFGSLFATFLVLTGVCAVAEYTVGAFSAWRWGKNPFWDYSDKFMNLHGHICLQFTLLFGAAATIFMLLVFPQTEKMLDKLEAKKIGRKPGRALFVLAGALWAFFWVCQLAFGVR